MMIRESRAIWKSCNRDLLSRCKFRMISLNAIVIRVLFQAKSLTPSVLADEHVRRARYTYR